MQKLLFFLVILLMSMQTHAQFTLEHIYDSTGYFQTSKDAMGNIRYGKQLFYLVNLEIDGDKYVQINESAQTIKFYNLNHTFWKTISYSNVTTNICPNSLDKTNNSILYISQSLFNTDAKIEFMYTCSWNYSADTSWKAITQIVNEDDSILFTDTAAAPLVVPTWANQYYPIYNTTNGTKMILSNVTGKAEVYSLAGTLTDGIAEANKKLMAMQSSVSNAYPNPNNGSAKIDYSLPPSINEGEIVFYNLQGTEVKRFKVDRTFNTLLISTKDIAAGTYYYQLQTAGESSGGKKMVVIK